MKRMTNKEYAKTEVFGRACNLAGIKPTKRQASKYRMSPPKGKAKLFAKVALAETMEAAAAELQKIQNAPAVMAAIESIKQEVANG